MVPPSRFQEPATLFSVGVLWVCRCHARASRASPLSSELMQPSGSSLAPSSCSTNRAREGDTERHRDSDRGGLAPTKGHLPSEKLEKERASSRCASCVLRVQCSTEFSRDKTRAKRQRRAWSSRKDVRRAFVTSFGGAHYMHDTGRWWTAATTTTGQILRRSVVPRPRSKEYHRTASCVAKQVHPMTGV